MKTRLFIASFILTVILGGCYLSNARAEENVVTADIVKEAEPATFDFLAEDGTRIQMEYVERCRDTRTGRYAKCPKEGENAGYIVSKLEKRCVDSNTKKFVKCPKDDKTSE